MSSDIRDLQKQMKAYQVYWVCLTGSGIGQWAPCTEFFDTEEQARAVAHAGFGPKPRAWWHVDILKRHSSDSFLFHSLKGGFVQREREDALAELSIGICSEAS